MKQPVRADSVTFIVTLPDDPDDLPLSPPNGFVWITGGSWYGSDESFGIASVRVSHDGETMDFDITLADALALRALIDQSIEAMRDRDTVTLQCGGQ